MLPLWLRLHHEKFRFAHTSSKQLAFFRVLSFLEVEQLTTNTKNKMKTNKVILSVAGATLALTSPLFAQDAGTAVTTEITNVAGFAAVSYTHLTLPTKA